MVSFLNRKILLFYLLILKSISLFSMENKDLSSLPYMSDEQVIAIMDKNISDEQLRSAGINNFTGSGGDRTPIFHVDYCIIDDSAPEGLLDQPGSLNQNSNDLLLVNPSSSSRSSSSQKSSRRDGLASSTSQTSDISSDFGKECSSTSASTRRRVSLNNYIFRDSRGRFLRGVYIPCSNEGFESGEEKFFKAMDDTGWDLSLGIMMEVGLVKCNQDFFEYNNLIAEFGDKYISALKRRFGKNFDTYVMNIDLEHLKDLGLKKKKDGKWGEFWRKVKQRINTIRTEGKRQKYKYRKRAYDFLSAEKKRILEKRKLEELEEKKRREEQERLEKEKQEKLEQERLRQEQEKLKKEEEERKAKEEKLRRLEEEEKKTLQELARMERESANKNIDMAVRHLDNTKRGQQRRETISLARERLIQAHKELRSRIPHDRRRELLTKSATSVSSGGIQRNLKKRKRVSDSCESSSSLDKGGDVGVDDDLNRLGEVKKRAKTLKSLLSSADSGVIKEKLLGSDQGESKGDSIPDLMDIEESEVQISGGDQDAQQSLKCISSQSQKELKTTQKDHLGFGDQSLDEHSTMQTRERRFEPQKTFRQQFREGARTVAKVSGTARQVVDLASNLTSLLGGNNYIGDTVYSSPVQREWNPSGSQSFMSPCKREWMNPCDSQTSRLYKSMQPPRRTAPRTDFSKYFTTPYSQSEKPKTEPVKEEKKEPEPSEYIDVEYDDKYGIFLYSPDYEVIINPYQDVATQDLIANKWDFISTDRSAIISKIDQLDKRAQEFSENDLHLEINEIARADMDWGNVAGAVELINLNGKLMDLSKEICEIKEMLDSYYNDANLGRLSSYLSAAERIELERRIVEFDTKVKNTAIFLFSSGFDCFIPAGERLRTIVGSLTGLSQRKLTKEEYIKQIFLLPVDVALEVFAPKYLTKLCSAISKSKKIKQVVEKVGKFIEKSKKTRRAARDAAKVAKKGVGKAATKVASRSTEVILPKVKTFEQARNKALELVGDLGPGSTPWIGGMEKSAGFGKIIGRRSLDRKMGWRLDWDHLNPGKGIHINVVDFTSGKGRLAKKYCIPFQGNEDTFKTLLKHLNR